MLHANELLVEAAEEVGETVGVEAHQLKHRRMQTLNMEAGLVAVAMAGAR